MLTRLPLNQKGMSIILVILVVAVMALVMIGILNWNNQKVKLNQQLNVTVIADQIKTKLVGIVISPDSWQRIQSNNQSAFGYANTPSSTKPGLNLYLADPLITQPYYKASQATAGFDPSGNPCSEDNPFDSVDGSDSCPFHYDVTLKSRTYVNNNWLDTVHFEMMFKPATSKLVLNTKATQYTFDIVRNFNDRSVESACISVNGNFSSTSARCSTLLTPNVNCQITTAYRGPGAQGGSACGERTQNFTCPQGSVMKGVNGNGDPVCGPR